MRNNRIAIQAMRLVVGLPVDAILIAMCALEGGPISDEDRAFAERAWSEHKARRDQLEPEIVKSLLSEYRAEIAGDKLPADQLACLRLLAEQTFAGGKVTRRIESRYFNENTVIRSLLRNGLATWLAFSESGIDEGFAITPKGIEALRKNGIELEGNQD